MNCLSPWIVLGEKDVMVACRAVWKGELMTMCISKHLF